MAGRKVSGGAAVAMAVALVALLVVAAAAEDCRNQGRVLSECASYCTSGGGGGGAPSGGCCDALRGADLGCLCSKYRQFRSTSRYASCAMSIPGKCNMAVPTSCY
ncbi:hypothetical protein ACP70R_038867 [Stipagrostis hirtigluma subsp. patula]